MTLTGDRKREYQREWIAARRATWFSGKTCRDCGRTDGLELHHNDPDAKVSHRIWSWSWARIEAETAKCSTLCEACHARITAAHRPLLIRWDVVAAIRERYAAGESGEFIAQDVGVSRTYAYRIINGQARVAR
jgi:hypothetical protein